MNKPDWSKWKSKTNNFEKYSKIKSNLIYGTLPKKHGLVSVMILTYNRADGLKNALDSAIAQDYKKTYPIIVLDDSGFDKATDELMKEYCARYNNVVYYRHDKNLGQYANWNRACELSPTEWFCLLHDDDLLAPNYLSRVLGLLKKDRLNKLGLVGVYFWTKDERKISLINTALRGVTNTLTTMFIRIRRGAPIPITIEDNVKLIYTLSCCLMINRDKVKAVGGLDDSYFPSSDFVLTSKMNYYFSTAFLPEYLCYRGISENESLKRETCEKSIECAYHHTYAMLSDLHPTMPESVRRRKASFAAVAAEIGVLGYNDIDYSKIKTSLGMEQIYNSNLTRLVVLLLSRFTWGTLIFRKNPLKEG